MDDDGGAGEVDDDDEDDDEVGGRGGIDGSGADRGWIGSGSWVGVGIGGRMGKV